MEDCTVAADHHFLTWCLQQPGVPPHSLTTLSPDFLVISPPKTGSTWLAANLRCHPQVFVPDIKEIKYFSSLCKWLDLNWYLAHFGPAAGRIKGEASPSYALLPVERIRLVRRLLPRVKLIFLMRDPIARAWSHIKHNHRFREAYFASCAAGFEAITPGQWCGSCAHDWPLASGDYLGELRRWLTVFPREQFYVGFYEAIASHPEALLQGLFHFLGVNPDVEFSTFRVWERILVGQEGELPSEVERFLRHQLHDRTRELAAFLHEHFDLEPPPEWRTTLAPLDDLPASNDSHSLPSLPDIPSPPPGPARVFQHELDDRCISRVLALEEEFFSGPRPVLEGYRGYDIVFCRGRLYAWEQALGTVSGEEMAKVELQRVQDDGRCFIASSLAEVKERIDAHIFSRAQVELRTIQSLHADLRATREHLCRLEHRLDKASDSIRRIEAEPRGASSWRAFLVPLLSRVCRRLRVILGAIAFRKTPPQDLPSPDLAPRDA